MRLLCHWRGYWVRSKKSEEGGCIARRPDSSVWGCCDLEEVTGYDSWRLRKEDELQGGQTVLYDVAVTLKRLLGTIHEDWGRMMNCKEARQFCMRLLWPWRGYWVRFMKIEEGGWIARMSDSCIWDYFDLEEVTEYDPWRLKVIVSKWLDTNHEIAWDLRCLGFWRSADWSFFADVSGQPMSPTKS